MKYQTKKQWPLFSVLTRVFLDPFLAMSLANLLGGTVPNLAWLSGYSYWAWVGIVILIQTLWGTDTQHLIIEPYKSLKEQV
jgi:hypothetical protein